MKYLFLVLTLLSSFVVAQGPNSCACVWSDSEGNLNCSFGNCGGGNWNACYNQVSTPNLHQTNTCPDPPTTNCDPYMWNTSLNGSCWYQGSGCSGTAVCDYVTNPPLPVELVRFRAHAYPKYNLIEWNTASEYNNSHFVLQHFVDTNTTTTLITLPGSGNSQQPLSYTAEHRMPDQVINYYFLIQIDLDGTEKYYGPIAIDNRTQRRVTQRFNLLGQPVTELDKGFQILFLDDNTTLKTYSK